MEKFVNQCPCGSTKDYVACCGRYHCGKAQANTPESLMRSRYSAYTMADVDYIKKTMRGKALIGFNEADAKQWASSLQWMGLEVIKSEDGVDENTGFVEFIARYKEKGTFKNLHEISQFQRIDGVWYYTEGKPGLKTKSQNTPRNAPCPCGSTKKYKNCHGKSGR